MNNVSKKGKVIVLSGKKRVGKDTVSSILSGMISNKGKYFYKIAIAGKIKKMLSVLTGNSVDAYLDRNKEEVIFKDGLTPRDMYRKLGDLIRDNLGKTYLIDQVVSKCNRLVDFYNYVFITDMRYLHEFEELKKLDPIFIRVKKDVEGDNHSSEVDLDNLPDSEFDYVIDNNGSLKDLENNLQKLFYDKL